MKRLSIIALIPMVAMLAAGCAKAPTEKLSSVEKAVEDAKTGGSTTYMAEDFAKLQSMLTAAKNEIAEQDAKFAFLRDYEKSEQLLTTLQADVSRVAIEAAKRKDEAKISAVQAQQVAQESVKKAQDLVAMAPVGKDRAALQEIKADVDGLTASMSDVQSAMDAGDYKAAQAKSQAIQEKSQQVSTEIETALAKVHKTKPGKKK